MLGPRWRARREQRGRGFGVDTRNSRGDGLDPQRFKAWRDGPNEYEERQFIVDVDGDLQMPVLEAGKVSGWMWVDRTNIETLRENREPGDQLIYDSILEALDVLDRSKQA